MKDAGERSDLEAGMAKLFASETGKEVVEECVPHPRRLRLLEGVRDRAALPRRAAAADRRGHLRDPAHGDRQEAAGAEQDLDRVAAPMARDTRDADRAGRSSGLHAEVPALRKLQLVIRLELRAHGGDVPIWRVELPGPKIRTRPGRRRAHRRLGLAVAIQRAGRRGHGSSTGCDAYEHGDVKVTGDRAVLSLLGNVIQRRRARV